VDDVQAAREQTPITRETLQGTALASALDAQLLPGTAERPWRALISLRAAPTPGTEAPQVAAPDVDTALRGALATLPGVQLLDIGAELNAMYARYLREAAWQAGIGALAVLALLAGHLRSAVRLARLCVPIVAALSIVVAALAAMNVDLGILHLVGLLLVVAIGSNYALFFDHLRERGADPADTDTLASLLLANLTTVLSFGLLATSNIQALHAIGQVVAPGALLCLVLSAVFIAARRV
jgi:predicted exporter